MKIFADGIDVINGDQATLWAMDRKYIVSPINGILKYYRLGKLERLNPEIPFEKVSVVLSDVSLTILEVCSESFIHVSFFLFAGATIKHNIYLICSYAGSVLRWYQIIRDNIKI